MISDQFYNDVANCLDEAIWSYDWFNSGPDWLRRARYYFIYEVCGHPLRILLSRSKEEIQKEKANAQLPLPDYLRDDLERRLKSLEGNYSFNLDQTIDAILKISEQYSARARKFHKERTTYERRKLLNNIGVAVSVDLGMNIAAILHGINASQVLALEAGGLFIGGACGFLAYFVQNYRDGSLRREIRCRYLNAKPERSNFLLDIEQNPPHLADAYISETKKMVRQALTQGPVD